jgi:hypothetical protein
VGPTSEKARAFTKNPPAGSKTRAALDFGIDPSLTVAMGSFERLPNV